MQTAQHPPPRDGQALLGAIWSDLAQATTRRTGFTRAALATATADGQPRVRSIIVRDFTTNPARIAFATAMRSAKVTEIRHNPQVGLLFYDDDRSVQCRVEGLATVVTDDVTRRRAWEALGSHTRQTYDSAAVPGALHGTVDESDQRTPFERFAWISVDLKAIDWLDLSDQPHQRWQFQRRGTAWDGQLVNP